MTLFDKLSRELLIEMTAEEYEEVVKNAQEKIAKNLEKYKKQMESPVAKKVFSYIAGLNLIFDINQSFTDKTKTFKVRDTDNKRAAKAKILAQKYDTEAEFRGTTPVVKIDDLTFVFKNASSAGGNEGIEFERKIEKALKEGDLKNDTIKKVLDELDADINDVEKVESVGGKNQKRPLIIQGGKIDFGFSDTDEIGEKVSDIDLTMKNGDVHHLSLKYGQTLTFINAGLGSPGPENKKMLAIINSLGIDEERFVQGFEDYEAEEGVKQFWEDFDGADKKELERLLKFSMGSNYVYVHNEHVFKVDKKKNKEMISNVRNVKIMYPGVGRKRVDLKFETNGFKEIKINLRNKKGGGVWPSHFLLDYKIR